MKIYNKDKNTINFFYDSAKINRPWSFNSSRSFQSGTDFSIINLAKLLRNKFIINFFCTKLPEKKNLKKINIFYCKNFREVLNKISSNDFLIFCNSGDEYLKIISKPLKKRNKLIIWLQNTPSFDWFYKVNKNPNIYKFITVSDSQRLGQAHIKDFKKIISIPNLIKYKKKIKIKKINKKEFLFIGSLTPSKGFLTLAKIWSKLYMRYPEWKLKVAGDIDLYSSKFKKNKDYINYKNKCLSYFGNDIQKAKNFNVFFKGNLNHTQLKKEIINSKFTVVNCNLKHSFETFCNSAAESLFFGKPVIGAAKGSLPEIVKHNYGGLLHKTENELQTNLISLFKNDSLIYLLGKNGQKNFLTKYNSDKIKHRWLSIFRGDNMNNYFIKKIYLNIFFEYLYKSFLRIFFPYSIIRLIKNINYKK